MLILLFIEHETSASQGEINTSASQAGVNTANVEPLRIGATATVTGRQIHINENRVTLEDLKIKLVNDDIDYRKKKAEEELRFLKESNKLKLAMLQEEFKNLKERNALDTEEKKLKIALLKKELGQS
ncbi:hypothetical protein EVAR_2382_1 [Eumeta japonica]|uniref:Uncharacterized protein n=1 Tax=Eumeta variegata TaxID=151549 RepID=A0A4C2AFL8_EUMVA|nr:hypothetical protein EVAR_2382_1 [Eumeta japonica]